MVQKILIYFYSLNVLSQFARTVITRHHGIGEQLIDFFLEVLEARSIQVWIGLVVLWVQSGLGLSAIFVPPPEAAILCKHPQGSLTF